MQVLRQLLLHGLKYLIINMNKRVYNIMYINVCFFYPTVVELRKVYGDYIEIICIQPIFTAEIKTVSLDLKGINVYFFQVCMYI